MFHQFWAFQLIIKADSVMKRWNGGKQWSPRTREICVHPVEWEILAAANRKFYVQQMRMRWVDGPLELEKTQESEKSIADEVIELFSRLNSLVSGLKCVVLWVGELVRSIRVFIIVCAVWEAQREGKKKWEKNRQSWNFQKSIISGFRFGFIA